MSNEQKPRGNSSLITNSGQPLTQLLNSIAPNAKISSEHLSSLISDFAQRFKKSNPQQTETSLLNRNPQPKVDDKSVQPASTQPADSRVFANGWSGQSKGQSTILGGSEQLDILMSDEQKVADRLPSQKVTPSNYVHALKQHFLKNTILQTTTPPNVKTLPQEVALSYSSDAVPSIQQLAKLFNAQLSAEDDKSDQSLVRQEVQTGNQLLGGLRQLKFDGNQVALLNENHMPRTNPSNTQVQTAPDAEKSGKVSPRSGLRVGTTIIDSETFKGYHMDPFQKQVEKVLSHQKISNLSLDAYRRADHVQINHAMQRIPPELQKILRSMNFLVKFKGISHLHCQWLPGLRIVVNCDETSLLALLEYIMQQFCLKRPNTDSQAGNVNHPLNFQSSGVHGPNGLQEKANAQNINESLQCNVEKVLCTPKLFPLIHRSILPMIMDTWREDCVRVLDLLINISHENLCFGLKFTDFDPILKKEQIEEKRSMIEQHIQSPLEALNLTQLQNRLFNKDLKGPYEFWSCLGKIFKMIIIMEEDENTPIRQFCAILRTLSLFIFNKWKNECTDSYKMFKSRHNAITAGSKQSNKDLMSKQSQSNNQESDEFDIQLRDLMVFSRILRQNEEILSIQKQIGSTQGDANPFSDNSQTNGILSLFIENQKLLQNLMVDLKMSNKDVKNYEQDYQVAQKVRVAQTDQSLINLREKLLQQNSHAMVKLSDSSSKSRTIMQQLKQQSDSSKSFGSEPYFLFHLYKQTQQSEQSSQHFKNPNESVNISAYENQTNFGGQPQQSSSQQPSNHFSLGAILNEQANRNQNQPEKGLIQSLQKNIERFLAQVNGQDQIDNSGEEFLKQQSKQSQSNPSNPNNTARQSKPTNYTSNQNQSSNRTDRQLQQNGLPSKLRHLRYLTDSDFSIVSKSKTQSKSKQEIMGKHKRTITELFNYFKTNSAENKQSNEQKQDSKNEPIGQDNELHWLLFVGESTQEIYANPYLFQGDVLDLIDGLFKRDHQFERDSTNSIDMKTYYLGSKGKPESSKEASVPNLGGQNFTSEPLFLVKWEGLSYADATWERISALKGQNLKKVHEFLDCKQRLSQQHRQFIAEQSKVQSQLTSLNQQLLLSCDAKLNYAKIFKVEKELMNSFIQTAQISEVQSMDRNSEEIVSQAKTSIRLSTLQKRSLDTLREAFKSHTNVLLLDQHGLGKRVTLSFFLQSLKERFNLYGPFLIITSVEKLGTWKKLINQLTTLKPLVYHDSNLKEGMANIRRWCLYCQDVTIKGNLTVRNKSQKFNVLITTAEIILDQSDPEIREIPFMQVIVDQAEIESHREASKQIACKRIICSTSNPIPNTLTDALELVRVIDPMPFVNTDLQGMSCKISSFEQLESMQSIMNQYACKQYESSVETHYGKLNQIEIEVPMTPAQLTIYSCLYLKHRKLLTMLEKGQTLDSSLQAKLEKFEKLLLKTCSSIFLIDKEEQIFDQCKQIKQLSKKEMKTSLRQQLVSGKVSVLQQIVNKVKLNTNKAIICTHYPHMIVLLKKVFKETGVACFSHQPHATMDSVHRFNLYTGHAVFFYHIGQTWAQEECSKFDLDLIQNVIIFDQEGPYRNDLTSLFKMCSLPFQVNLTVYRLMAAQSFEQKLYQRKSRMQMLQSLLFGESNAWKQSKANLSQLQLNYPLEISTREEVSPNKTVSNIPAGELDLLMKLSTEPIIQAQNKLQNIRQKKIFCLADLFQNALINQDLEQPELEHLIQQANQTETESPENKVMKAFELCKTLEESKLEKMPRLQDADFYQKVLGLDSTLISPCNHYLCDKMFSLSSESTQPTDQDEPNYAKLHEIFADLGNQRQNQVNFNLELKKSFQLNRAEKEKGRRAVESENGMMKNRQNQALAINLSVANSKLQLLINKGGDFENNHLTKMGVDIGPTDFRKPLSEEDRQDSLRADVDKMDFLVINRHAQASEDNTIQKPFGSEENNSADEGKMLTDQKHLIKIACKEEKKLNQIQNLNYISTDQEQHVAIGQIPDKLLPHGKICQSCFFAIPCDKQGNSNASNGPVYTCLGYCKKVYHMECALKLNIMVPNTLQRSQLKQSIVERPSTDSAREGPNEPSSQQGNGEEYVFHCKHCSQNKAQCYICKDYSEIFDQNLQKEQNSLTEEPQVALKESQQPDKVEKCIVGPCLKYYHIKCLSTNSNVDFYTNNRNQSRFRCPLHYCSGCSISGNSVQILQCTACPSSYHLKCFRADRNAVKLTKKFILCGQHEDLKRAMQLKQQSGSRKQPSNSLSKQKLTSGPSLASATEPAAMQKQKSQVITLSGRKMTMGMRMDTLNHLNQNVPSLDKDQIDTQLFSQKLKAIKQEMTKQNDPQTGQESRQDASSHKRDIKNSMKTYIRINSALNKYYQK